MPTLCTAFVLCFLAVSTAIPVTRNEFTATANVTAIRPSANDLCIWADPSCPTGGNACPASQPWYSPTSGNCHHAQSSTGRYICCAPPSGKGCTWKMNRKEELVRMCTRMRTRMRARTHVHAPRAHLRMTLVCRVSARHPYLFLPMADGRWPVSDLWPTARGRVSSQEMATTSFRARPSLRATRTTFSKCDLPTRTRASRHVAAHAAVDSRRKHSLGMR